MLAIAALAVAPARVQTQSSTPIAVDTKKLGFNGGTTGTLNTTGANLLVACVSYAGNVTPPQISDSKGNSWTLAVAATGSQDSHIRLFYSVPATVGSGHTFTVTGNGSMSSISLMAFAGVAASPLDKTAGAFSTGATIQPGSVTPSQNDELLISCLTNTDTSDSNRSINGGFTIAGQHGWDGSTYSNGVAAAYGAQTTATAANPTWSYPTSNPANAVIATFRTTENGGGGGGSLASKPLFQALDMGTLNGGFRVPNFGQYAGNGLSFYNNTLFIDMEREDSSTRWAQITIPTPVNTGTITNMSRASYVNAGLVDPMNGNGDGLNDPTDGNQTGHYSLGALFAYGGYLYGAASIPYDSGNPANNENQRVSHFRRNIDLDVTTGFAGWFSFGSLGSSNMARYFTGHMTPIPSYAQTALGGPMLATGQGALSVLSLTSVGPAAASFDPADFAGKSHMDTVPANYLLYYSLAHPFQNNLHSDCQRFGVGYTACPDEPSQWWNQATQIGGSVIPDGYRSLLFFVQHGDGDICYGNGTTNSSLWGTPVGDGSIYCPSPLSTSKGGHAAGPWKFMVYAYDLLELAEVKAGTRQPWNLFPYAKWEINVPNTYQTVYSGNNWGAPSGVAYDPATRRIFFSQAGADPAQYSNHPVVWQWTHTAAQ